MFSHVTFLKYFASCAFIILFLQAKTIDRFFPPLVFFPKNEDLNRIIEEHVEIQLKGLKEGSFWTTLRDEPKTEAYRFLWLSVGEPPTVITIKKSNESISLHVSQHDGGPGFTVGKLVTDKRLILNNNEWGELVECVKDSNFWSLPAEVKESGGMADGDVIFLEGIKSKQYHIMHRNIFTMGERCKTICRFMLIKSKERIVDAWDERCRKARMLHDYRAEPPQTPDLEG